MAPLTVYEQHEKERLEKLRLVTQNLDSLPLHKDCLSSCSKPIPINKFHHPPNPQTSSSLFQLPTELRLKILRRLLVNGSPITTYQAYHEGHNNAPDHIAKKSDWLSLSSQILWCCQHLYREGLAMLYQENTITLHAFRWTVRRPNFAYTYFLTILDEYTRFGECPLPTTQGELESIPDKSTAYWWEVFSLPGQDSLKSLSRTTCQTLLRFSKIHLRVGFDDRIKHNAREDMDMLSIAWLLQTYVAGKNVTVSIHRPEDTARPQWSIRLKCFEIWRCESIEFLNSSYDDSVLVDRQIKQTQRTISSPNPVKDTLRIMVEFYNLMCGLNGYFSPRDSFSEFYEWDDIQDALVEQDEQKFAWCVGSLLWVFLEGWKTPETTTTVEDEYPVEAVMRTLLGKVQEALPLSPDYCYQRRESDEEDQ